MSYLGNQNIQEIINATGQYITFVPGSTIDYLLSNVTKNVTIIRDL